MPAEIRITDDDIVFAENILFSDGEEFDDERIVFIKNLNTIDLQAVPGSGKTTALMAKLLILERYLPLDDNSGVLVISHTNAAIDEIKSKIGQYCSKLFSYPNFVGTIQGFVDQFLAIPYYVRCYKAKPCRIDGDTYNDRAKYYYYQLTSRARGWVERKNKPTKFFQALRFDVSLNITNGVNGKIELRAENDSDTYQQIRDLKSDMMADGYLHFDDAYFLAGRYMARMPKIVNLLQGRFRFVFVDEMQDMEKHQHDLLERIFFDNANSVSKYQRIGDKNQAIYSGKVTLDGIWSERETLTINGSHRLTPPIAELVNCFALHRDAGFQVRGLRRLRNGEISPHLIVYDDTNIGDVIRKYSEIINGLVTEEKIPSSETGSEGIKSRFKVIAWRKNPSGENKIGISDYFPGFDYSRR
jgi:superfamily I DNA/RNA helicase